MKRHKCRADSIHILALFAFHCIIPLMLQHRKISVAAIILAAGRSSRMGRPKMLLPWGGTTVLGHLIALWTKTAADQIAVVHAAGDPALASELDRLHFPVENRIINPQPDRGMFSSVQCAAQWAGWKPGLTHWAIALGDQPHIQSATLAALIDFAARHPDHVCQPRHRGGRARHPVLIPAATFPSIALSKGETLKHFLQSIAAPIQLMDIDDPGLELDIDLPEDYQKALRLAFGP